jgi:hypothetical protein
MKIPLNHTKNTTKISKPNLFKRGREIIREINNRAAKRRRQISKRVSYHIGLTLNSTETTKTKINSKSSNVTTN